MEEYVKSFLLYLGYDEPYDAVVSTNAERSLLTALSFAQDTVGRGYTMNDDHQFDELVFIYAEDLFNKRGVSGKVSGATRRMVQGMETHLALKHRVMSTSELNMLLTGEEGIF